MANRIKLPRNKCMKCDEEFAILMSPITQPIRFIGQCTHKFCRQCFRNENSNLSSSVTYKFACPCCHFPFYEIMQSIDEAVVIGEALTMRIHLHPLLIQPRSTVITAEDLKYLDETNKEVMKNLESILQLNPANFYTLYLLFVSCCDGSVFLTEHKQLNCPAEFYRLQLFDHAYKLLDHPTVSGQYDVIVRSECCFQLALAFELHYNYPAALKYSKLAYEHCLRSTDHSTLSNCKDVYLELCATVAEMSPLRFAVGEEVEVLHESEWKLGKVIELHFRERDFEINFTAPYRLQLQERDADAGPVYTVVTVDLDRYVRKVGVRSIEDTRYQARLDAKVEQLTHVYCSREIIQDIYDTLAQDQEFVQMLLSTWDITLSVHMVSLYRMLVHNRLVLRPTVTGYCVFSTELFISMLRHFFEPYHLRDGAVPTPDVMERFSQAVRADIISMLQGNRSSSIRSVDYYDIKGHLLQSIKCFIEVLSSGPNSSGSYVNLLDRGSDFTLPLEVSEAISKASNLPDLMRIRTRATHNTRLGHYVDAWIYLYSCLTNTPAGHDCECPFVYFFVKYCLDQGLGVPKVGLVVYDQMNLQLVRHFTRCANSNCERSKLDRSVVKATFQQCSRCKSVIYCSRECQTAHYLMHKRFCTEPSTG